MALASNKFQPIAFRMDGQHRQMLAVQSLNNKQTIVALAKANQVSRQFVHAQKRKLLQSANKTFSDKIEDDQKPLFLLPVTKEWIEQFILSLVLDCRATFRGVIKAMRSLLDYGISIGTISKIVKDAITKAIVINAMQDLSNVKLGAHDELFHQNKPILAGIDIISLYCYLLSHENHRDGDTWGIHLLDLIEQKFDPDRVFGDDASGLALGHHLVLPETPFHLDNFHLTKELIELRRFFRNRLKTSTTYNLKMMQKIERAKLVGKPQKYTRKVGLAQKDEAKMRVISQSIDTLVDWMLHDVLNKPGYDPENRRELYDFIVTELEKLADIYSHRISPMVTTLKNQCSLQLAFVDVLDNKFKAISEKYDYSLEMIWKLCQLQRYKHNGASYSRHSLPLRDHFKKDFYAVEQAVIQALDSTERTSSMVENLNSRIAPYCFLRQEVGHGFLDLLRFYLNHSKFLRSERKERRGKTPTEILTKKEHPPWLEMLGYKMFKQAA